MRGKVENIVGIEKLEDIVTFAKDSSIDLVCIGPEQPLVDGLCDLMKAAVSTVLFFAGLWCQNIPCVGPAQNASRLESSKAWSKDFMQRNNIPTARFRNFQDLNAALEHLDLIDYDVVIKVAAPLPAVPSPSPDLDVYLGFWLSCWKRCRFTKLQRGSKGSCRRYDEKF
jgi:phosphoribosylamine-glycine ligase